jgi:diguanylate cyclase (GGDEF)-like protein
MYVMALVLVPQAGVGLLTTAVVRHQQGEVDSAHRAEVAVQTLAQIDAARNGVEHEIVPSLSLAVVSDPEVAMTLGIPAAAESPVVVSARDGLTALRSRVDAGGLDLESSYFAYVDLSNTLAHAQNQAAAAAGSEAVPAATVRATRDVEIVAALAQASARAFPLFLASQLDAGDVSAGARISGESAWLTYQDAQRRMADLSQPALRDAWARARTNPSMTRLNELLSAQADGSLGRMTLEQLRPMLADGLDRDAALNQLVATAVASARASAAADAARSQESLESTLHLGVGILLVSGVAATAVGIRMHRALGGLAEQAGQISEGRLVDVAVAGPREVRTVSAALGSAVASLRQVQAQAAAVAQGDLDDALLDQQLPGALGEAVHASVRQLVTSVREREQLQVALAHRATHDPLTELPNRAQAVAAIAGALQRAQRAGGVTGLLFVDLDGFKSVNDRYGHACGDAVLRLTAARMLAAVRAGDTVARLGGDEFVVLVERVEDEQELVQLAERLVTVVSVPAEVEGRSVHIGASIGVAVCRDGGTDVDALVAEADTAAYRAKAHGRGRVEVFDDDLRRQLTARADTETAIAAGLANGEMRLHYQPVHDLARGVVTGFEALIRWQRPGIGLVSPDQFVPVAEASALICDIDRWVLGEATRQLAEWRAAAGRVAGQPEPTVAVNVSGRHLAEPRVVCDVAEALLAAGLPAHLLVIEVTETVLISDHSAYDHLAALREMGVGIAIDDFGTGYTSIGQLRHTPADTLKIDRSFVGSTDPGHRELVSLMIRAAHTFGLTVVAEGVEETEQLDRLRAEGCDHAQGYLLHPPLPAEQAGALVGAVLGV